jgi:hypothetical protein
MALAGVPMCGAPLTTGCQYCGMLGDKNERRVKRERRKEKIAGVFGTVILYLPTD